jgi:hypothetical protein
MVVVATLDGFEQAAAQIEGLATDRHALLLYGLCRWLNVRQAVEVGAYKGKCSVWMARAIQQNGGGQLSIIDDFSLSPQTESELRANLEACGVQDACVLIKADSQEMERFPDCELAFIDGDHSLDGCLADAAKAVMAGARCLVFHDTCSWWGPRGFIELLRGGSTAWNTDNWDVLEANHDEGLAVLLRRASQPAVTYSREQCPRGCI